MREFEHFISCNILQEGISSLTSELHYATLSEADKTTISNQVVESLYKKAVSKYEKIYFEDIPKTEGDITLTKAFPELVDTVKLMESLSFNDDEMTKRVNQLKLALTHMVSMKETFKVGFKIKSALPIIIYNTMTMAIIEYASILLSAHITYVSAFNLTGDMVINIDTTSNYFKTYEKNIFTFNTECTNGHMSKVLEASIGAVKNNFLGTALASTSIVMIALFAILPMIKEMIYQLFYQKERLSSWCKLQSRMLEINASSLDNIVNEKSINKQKRLAKTLKELSKKLAMDADKANKLSNKEGRGEKLSLESIKAPEEIDFSKITLN